MALLAPNFNSLSPLEKRAAVEMATGLSWEQYTALPGEQKTALLLSLKGVSVQGTASDMLGAARTDATLNRLAGYWGGVTGATKLLLIAAAVGAVWLALPMLGNSVAKVRKAVSA